MTFEVGDVEIDVFKTPSGYGYWFVSPYGNVVTRREKVSVSHALNAARLALKYYTELPATSGKNAVVVQPGIELDHSIDVKTQNLAYCAKYFEGVQKRRAIDRWFIHNVMRIMRYELDPLPLPEELRPYISIREKKTLADDAAAAVP